jgi:heme/copper-type cytochrome/quinol oxidase subunit 2
MKSHTRFSRKNLLTVLLFILALVVVLAPVPVLAAPVERTVRVEASGYAFTPGVVRVNPGDLVTIELVAKDVSHGLSVDGYPVDLHAEPGQTARTTFVVGKAGTFKMRCSVACGNLHPFMTGRLVVGPNLLLVRGIGLALIVVGLGIVRRRNG